MTEHEHHDHAPVVANDAPGCYDVMETAFQKLMIEKGYFTAGRAKLSCSDRLCGEEVDQELGGFIGIFFREEMACLHRLTLDSA